MKQPSLSGNLHEPELLRAVSFNCTLKKTHGASSTQVLLEQVAACMKPMGVETEFIRVADFNVLPGVTSNEGKGDAWPAMRRKVMAADIVIVGTPIWLGQPSSVCKRILERMDAFLEEKDPHGRMPAYGKVGAVAIVGNEDGAHHVSAEVYQAMNDVGFSLAPNACTYWVGEAMGEKNYNAFKKAPKKTAKATELMCRNTVYLARLLHEFTYPGK